MTSYKYFQGTKTKKEASKAYFPLGMGFYIRKTIIFTVGLSTLPLTTLNVVETGKVDIWEKKIRFSCYGYNNYSLSRIIYISFFLEKTDR